MMDCVPSYAQLCNELLDEIRGRFPDCIIDSVTADGKIHKFKLSSDDAKSSGWYSANYLYDIVFATIGSWKDSEQYKWRSSNYSGLSASDRKRVDDANNAQKAQVKGQRAELAERVKNNTGFILRKQRPAVECPIHPYLERKGLLPCVGMMQGEYNGENSLYIPMYDDKRELVSFQRINEAGDKRYRSGGKKGFFPIGDDSAEPCCIAEGVATALSIHYATGWQCFCAFDSAGLEKTADVVRRDFPDRVIVICADDDALTKAGKVRAKNPGLIKAKAVALKFGCALAVPAFNDHKGRSDFDDMRQEQGLDAVRACICQAVDVFRNGGAVGSVSAVAVLEPAQADNAVQGSAALVQQAGGGSSDESVVIGSFLYSVKDSGLYCKDLGDDDERPVQIASYMRVVGLIRDENNGRWGVVVVLRDRDNVEHRIIIPMTMFKGDGQEWRALLLDYGAVIMHDPKSRKRLGQYLTGTHTDVRVRSVDVVGWHDGVYVTAEKAIGASREEVLFNNDDVNIVTWEKAGTLREWIDNVSAKCAGNSRFVLGVCVAFASVLLELSGQENRCFHVVGDSSKGKSTALMVACSVFGNPTKYKRSWRATDNGLESVAVMHNDGLMAMDEFSEIDTKAIINGVAYMLMNGSGKIRASKTGGGRVVKKWRTLLFSTGEMSLEGKAKAEGYTVNAGERLRFVSIESVFGEQGLVEVASNKEQAAAFIGSISENCQKFYGHAGELFVEYVANNREQMRERVLDGVSHFQKIIYPDNNSSQLGRVSKSFALVACAGEIATALGLTGWQNGEAIRSVKSCFDAFAHDFGEMNHEEKMILNHVVSVFVRHGSSRFDEADTTKSRPIIDRIGWTVRVFQGVDGCSVTENTAYVRPQQFSDVFCGNKSVRSVSSVLLKHKFLIPDREGKASCLVNGRSVKANRLMEHPSLSFGRSGTRFYVFDLDVIGSFNDVDGGVSDG